MGKNSGKRKSSLPNEDTPSYKKRQMVEDIQSQIGINRSEVKISKYAESHAKEILALKKAVQVQQGGHACTQKLPPHMRRRALSHNIKRLPRAIRAAAAHMFANQKGLNKKRPSRFYRRRPRNLLQEYIRRQRKHIWLETHIWHAKRFHMVEKWGHKLPWKPTQKSERAAYRASTKHCLLQDLSYMCCIELSGPQTVLLDGFAHVSSKTTGQTFAALSCLSGTREGQTVMYRYDQYPRGAIGPVTFMWRPVSKESGGAGPEPRHIWIWTHPACFQEVWDSFIQCFTLAETKATIDTIGQFGKKDAVIAENGDHTDVMDCDKIKPDGKAGRQTLDDVSDKFQGSGEVKSSSICDKFKTNVRAVNDNTAIQMISLSGSVLRFRLTGPQSNAVLFDALQQADVVVSEEPVHSKPWWDSYYSASCRALSHRVQGEIIESVKQCQSPAELTPHAILGLLVRDPRVNRPSSRTKVQADETGITEQSPEKQNITADMSSSALWDSNIREHVVSTKMPDYKIHELRSECLVPGLPLELGNSESRIPVILVQRPGASYTPSQGLNPFTTLGRGAGWDLLLPKSWGMPFWLALVFRGARCGGLREMENLCHEERSLLFPNDFPDSSAGRSHQVEQERLLVDKYNRRPPAKRINYTKYGMAAPFTCPWRQLMGLGSRSEIKDKGINGYEGKASADEKKMNSQNPAEDGVVCDTKTVKESSIPSIDFFVLRDRKLLRRLENILCARTWKPAQPKGLGLKENKEFEEIVTSLKCLQNSALIPVRIEILQRGVPKAFSSICLPTSSDLKQLAEDKNYGGPEEPRHEDPVTLLKLEKKQEMKEKMIKKKVKVDRTLNVLNERGQVNVDNCSRRTIGYQVNGGYSLGIGGGSGVGYVSAEGLHHLLMLSQESQDTRGLVLVRGQSTLLYRFAKLSILV